MSLSRQQSCVCMRWRTILACTVLAGVDRSMCHIYFFAFSKPNLMYDTDDGENGMGLRTASKRFSNERSLRNIAYMSKRTTNCLVLWKTRFDGYLVFSPSEAYLSVSLFRCMHGVSKLLVSYFVYTECALFREGRYTFVQHPFSTLQLMFYIFNTICFT